MSGEMMTIAPLLTVVFGAVAVLIADMLVPARRLTPITVALVALGAAAVVITAQGGGVTSALAGAYVTEIGRAHV